MIRFALVFVVCLGLAHAFAAEAPVKTPSSSGSRLADLFDDPVIARGQGVEVKQSALDESFIAFKANLAARGERIPEDHRLFRETQLLERLIVTQILVKRATPEDITRAKEAAAKFAAETRKLSESEEGFKRRLKSLGITSEQFDQRVYEQALAEAVVERELKSKIAVTDAQVENFYRAGSDVLVEMLQEELERVAKNRDTSVDRLTGVKRQIEEIKKTNLARLQQPEKVRVSHVLLTTRDRETETELSDERKRLKRIKIEQILERARAGEEFAKLVQDYSEDRNLKETRGEYTFSRDDRFAQEFKAAAFSLEPGKISDIVTTVYGYHILKLHERIPAQKIALEKVSGDIREHLVQQELQRQMPDYFAKLKKEAGVEILEAKYRITVPREVEPLKPTG
jgi:parvulin-like peptidyl-prolyl isomerase